MVSIVAPLLVVLVGVVVNFGVVLSLLVLHCCLRWWLLVVMGCCYCRCCCCRGYYCVSLFFVVFVASLVFCLSFVFSFFVFCCHATCAVMYRRCICMCCQLREGLPGVGLDLGCKRSNEISRTRTYDKSKKWNRDMASRPEGPQTKLPHEN